MPKDRYGIMKAYMPKKGTKGLDMMFRTCTVQVNLDFSSEQDMREKFRIGMALQPIATALFANSPFKEGKPSGKLSLRSDVWTDTDPDRCGNLPFVFDENSSFEQYVDYALDVPMYFVHRDDRGYIDTSGQSFRDFLEGKLPGYPGQKPTLKDWDNHLTTIFTEVRMKKFLEMLAVLGPGYVRCPHFGLGFSTTVRRRTRRWIWLRTGPPRMLMPCAMWCRKRVSLHRRRTAVPCARLLPTCCHCRSGPGRAGDRKIRWVRTNAIFSAPFATWCRKTAPWPMSCCRNSTVTGKAM